jgi:hypothetical protein
VINGMERIWPMLPRPVIGNSIASQRDTNGSNSHS